MEESDVLLIRRAKRGDADAFAQLVRNYKNFVWKTAMGILLDPVEAEDVVQEAFVRTYLSLKDLRKAETFPSWLATVTTRLAIDAARKAAKRSVPTPLPEHLLDVASQRGYGEIETRMVLESLMAKLSVDERTTLVLRELEGLSYQEMADRLDIPIGTVRSRLFTARTALKTLLGEWERGEWHDNL